MWMEVELDANKLTIQFAGVFFYFILFYFFVNTIAVLIPFNEMLIFFKIVS